MDIAAMIMMPVSGAIIGYCTNWIAIKMLFRPYGEKRLFGLRLPFTPGLIPKGRYSIGQKIGKSVSENILTKEVLTNSISTPEIAAKLDGVISGALERLCSEDLTIAGVLGYLAPDGVFPAKQAEEGIAGLLMNLLESAAFRDKLSEFLSKNAEDIIANSDTLFQNALTGNQKTAADYLGSEAPLKLAELVGKNLPKAADFLTGLESASPELARSLRELVAKTAKDNFGSFVGIFVHYDKLYDKLINSAAEYLRDEGNQLLVKQKLSELLLKYSGMSISELSAGLPAGIGYSLRKQLSGEVMNNALGFLNTKLDGLIAEEAGTLTRNLSAWLVKNISAINLSDILRKLGDERKAKLTRFIGNTAMRLITSGGAHIVNSLDIGQIMADKFDEFEMREVEELVLSIAKRELNGITNMGAVLGFIIGLLPLIMEIL